MASDEPYGPMASNRDGRRCVVDKRFGTTSDLFIFSPDTMLACLGYLTELTEFKNFLNIHVQTDDESNKCAV